MVFSKGGINIEQADGMPIPRLMRFEKLANRINKECERANK